MVIIQDKRLMLSEGIECNSVPNLNDFMFFGGGGGKGGGLINTGLGMAGGALGGSKAPAVQKVEEKEKEKEIVRQAPATPVTQEGASSINQVGDEDDDLIGTGKRKTLGGVRKLSIPVTPFR